MNTNKILDAYYSTNKSAEEAAKEIADRLGYNVTDVYEILKAEDDANGHSDTDSGLGIGGINNDQSAPFVPSVKAIKKVESLNKKARKCRCCGQTDVWHGAMFTTDPSSGLCDDCY